MANFDVVSTKLVSDVDGILAVISADVHGIGNVRGVIRDDNAGVERVRA